MGQKKFDYSIEMGFELPNEETAQVVKGALKAEAMARHAKRSENSVNNNKNVLSFTFNAEDLTALKASVNSILRLMAVSLEIAKL